MSNLNIRLDDNLRAEATQILAGYGLTPSQAVKLFFNQIVATHKVPLSFEFQADSHKKPTAKLLRAIAEVDNDDLPTYDSIDELLGAVNEKV